MEVAMGALRKSLWMVAAIAALPASAAAQDMCGALSRVAAMLRDPAASDSLTEAARDGGALPGFGKDAYRISRGGLGGVGLYCFRTHAPANLDLSAMEQTLRDCPGVAPVLRIKARRQVRQPGYAGQWRDPDLLFIASGLRYGVETDCGTGCASGMLVSVDVVFANTRPRI
jgi:hypothetical protein